MRRRLQDVKIAHSGPRVLLKTIFQNYGVFNVGIINHFGIFIKQFWTIVKFFM